MPKGRQDAEKSPSDQGLGQRVTDPVHSLYLAILRHYLADQRKLLEWHDKARGDFGRPKKDLEVLKRASVLLTITSWETFVEDALQSAFGDRLRSVTEREMRGTFREVAKGWMKRNKTLADNPERLADSAGGWKAVVQAEFASDLHNFHNPDSKKIRRIYQKYLEVDVTAKWRWRGVTSTSACQQLDTLMTLRHKLTHSAEGMGGAGVFNYEAKAVVQLKDAVNAITLVERLAECTLLALPAFGS